MSLNDLLSGNDKFSKLEMEYKNFYAPSFLIEVEGENLLKKGIEITDISVSDSLNAAGSFTFNVNNAFDPLKKDFRWVDDLLVPGNSVTIRMGYTDRQKLMMIGNIVSLRVDFPSGGIPRLQVSGRDFLDSMMKDSRPNTWENMTYKQVVEDIITKKYKAKYKIKTLETGETKLRNNTISQNQKSDFQFLKEIAEENNFEFFVRGDAFFFRERPKDGEPEIGLEWGRSLLSFSPEVNLAGQVSMVSVTGWDHKKKLIEGKSKNAGALVRRGKSGREMVKESYGECSVMHRHINAESKEEADVKAEAIHKNIENKLVTGNGESIGLPEIRTGMYIGLEGLGKKFSRSYYLVSTEHTVNSSGYRTNFNVEADSI